MASVQLPPRQKMINMLYLVLTAMLALNVSKEVLDAFAIMDAELVRSERAHEQRSQLEYALFAAAAERLPEKFAARHQQALRVKAQADALVEHIERIKADAVASADKLDPSTLRGVDATGKDTLRALMALNAKDDRSTLTRMLVGPDPSVPHRSPGGAYDLKLQVAAYRDSLKSFTTGQDASFQVALDLLFDLGDRCDASGTWNNWESVNFYDVPLAAGVTTLSKIQADVRSAENDLVKWLYRSVEEADYKFGTLTAAVIPQSNLIMLGDSFRADVFLAAYDPRNPPEIHMAEQGTLPIGADGKAKLRLRGDQVGEQEVTGVIRFEGPTGFEEIPYVTKFQVMAPLLVASPTKMNVLYRGVENPIDLSVPGVPSDRIQAVTSNGRISRQGQGWVVQDLVGGTADVSAVVSMADGSTRRVGPMQFRVKDLPPPMAFVAEKTSIDNSVRKGAIAVALGVSARLDDSPFHAPYSVTRFQLTWVRKDGTVKVYSASGNKFTNEMKQVLEGCRPNDLIVIEEIRARLTNRQGRDISLSPIALRILP